MGLLSKKDTDSEKDFETEFHFPTSDKALLIFTRNPELGKVKTRLAGGVGDVAALDIYKFLLRHTVSITQNLSVDKQVFYSEKIRASDYWDENRFTKKLQHGNDLGARMQKPLKQELLQLLQEKDILLTQLHQHLQQHFLQEL